MFRIDNMNIVSIGHAWVCVGGWFKIDCKVDCVGFKGGGLMEGFKLNVVFITQEKRERKNFFNATGKRRRRLQISKSEKVKQNNNQKYNEGNKIQSIKKFTVSCSFL